MYVRAAELQASGINWVHHLLSEIPEKTRLVAELRADASFVTENERIEAFTGRGGGSRATYFNHKKRLRQAGEGSSTPLRIPLQNPKQQLSRAA